MKQKQLLNTATRKVLLNDEQCPYALSNVGAVVVAKLTEIVLGNGTLVPTTTA